MNHPWTQKVYQELDSFFYKEAHFAEFPQPELRFLNSEEWGKIWPEALTFSNTQWADLFSGKKTLPGVHPIAWAYAGHQYGRFVVLGDGRALHLGELPSPDKKSGFVDVGVKGSGPTLFARRGDGKARLGPMIKEVIHGEMMAGLGISATNSLAVITTGEWIPRENLGPGALLVRSGESLLRVGNFEYAARFGGEEKVFELFSFATRRLFGSSPSGRDSWHKETKIFFEEVVRRQAQLLADWTVWGFVHGVMNTDNMSLVGETLDFGPSSFLDTWDPEAVFSSIDQNGRYAFKNQVSIARWNLEKLAHCFPEGFRDDLLKILAGFENLQAEYLKPGWTQRFGENSPQIGEDLVTTWKSRRPDTNPFFMSRNFWVQFWMEYLELEETLCRKSGLNDLQTLQLHSSPLILEDPESIRRSYVAGTKKLFSSLADDDQSTKVSEVFWTELGTDPWKEFRVFLKFCRYPFTWDEKMRPYIIPINQKYQSAYTTYCGT